MNRAEVIKILGEQRIQAFDDFMYGQTVGILPNGEVDYYTTDVERFLKFIL